MIVATGRGFASGPTTTCIIDECPVHSNCNEKQLRTALSDIIRTNQVRAVAIIYSVEAVFTIAYGLLVHFVTWLPAGLVD